MFVPKDKALSPAKVGPVNISLNYCGAMSCGCASFCGLPEYSWAGSGAHVTQIDRGLYRCPHGLVFYWGSAKEDWQGVVN